MIDINLIRDDNNRQLVIESERKRFKNEKTIEQIYEEDKKMIKLKYAKEQNSKLINKKQKEISSHYKNKNELINENEYIIALKKEVEDLKLQNITLDKEISSIEDNLKSLLKGVGNILHQNVVYSNDEADNKLIRTYESSRIITPEKSFADIMDSFTANGRGTKISGHRGYFLCNDLALLANALTNYAIDFLVERNFILVQTPMLMNKEVMEKTAQLSDFDDQLYKVGENQYLIATSEQPISAMHMNERFDKSSLPLKYCGQSFCFRKEAGAHGKDNQGIFRVHQFQKIEQFVICAPSESQYFFEQMVSTAEEFLKSLDISFRTVSIVSGEMNDSASIKYDIEAYFPHQKTYRELVSVSNCTDYQSRELEIRYGIVKANDKKEYVHMLNGTLCAIQRCLCCLVENYQTRYGIVVPDVLKKYFKKGFIGFN
ncbi:Serine--tRNA ligase [Dictyocoela muelleri]|nr:Serine--tRNA ligase [Dictyocoela muelleri]